jgi:hypothetical protein
LRDDTQWTIEEASMQVYGDFSPEEQVLLRRSLLAVAVAVSAASPGRGEETVSEGFAAASFILDRRDDYVRFPLITSVIAWLQEQSAADQPFPDFVKAAEAPNAEAEAMDTLRGVVEMLDTRVDAAEAAAYKGWLMSIANAVATAGKEDQGFLGRGGVAVNDRERAVLAEISSVLGIDPEAAPAAG